MQSSHAPKISPEVNGCFAGNNALPGSDSRSEAARTEALASLAVLNRWNQSHDIKNLFVMDGSSFVLLRKREL